MDFTAVASLAPSPHVELLVEADPGMVLTDVEIRRDGRPLRSRAVLGGDSYEVVDYEAPFGRFASYRADVTVNGGWSSVFTEDWSALSEDWQTLTGSPDVLDNQLVGDGVERAAVGNYLVTQPDIGRVVINGYVGNPLGSALIIGPVIVAFHGASVTVQHLLSGPARVAYSGGDIEVVWSETSARLTTSQGSVSVDRGTSDWALAAGALVEPGGFVPGFEVFETDPEVVESHVLFATTHVPEKRVWLIHPTAPTLSIPIDDPQGAGPRFIEAGTRRDVDHVGRFASFEPDGRDVSVVYPTGPRRLPDWNLNIACRDLAARDAVLDLLRDSQPVLLRVPDGYGNGLFDIPDGWYQVEKVGETAVGARGVHGIRILTLEARPTNEPPTSISQSATWASLVANGLTWGDLLGHSWYDVLVGVGGNGD